LNPRTLKLKKLFKEAFDAGDSDKMAEANDLMSRLAIENERLRIQKIRVEQAGAIEANARQNQKVERTASTSYSKTKIRS
jgi:hypothetical protein